MLKKIKNFIALIEDKKEALLIESYLQKMQGDKIINHIEFWQKGDRARFYPVQNIDEDELIKLIEMEENISDEKSIIKKLSHPLLSNPGFVKKVAGLSSKITRFIDVKLNDNIDVIYSLIYGGKSGFKDILLFTSNDLLKSEKTLFKNILKTREFVKYGSFVKGELINEKLSDLADMSTDFFNSFVLEDIEDEGISSDNKILKYESFKDYVNFLMILKDKSVSKSVLNKLDNFYVFFHEKYRDFLMQNEGSKSLALGENTFQSIIYSVNRDENFKQLKYNEKFVKMVEKWMEYNMKKSSKIQFSTGFTNYEASPLDNVLLKGYINIFKELRVKDSDEYCLFVRQLRNEIMKPYLFEDCELVEQNKRKNLITQRNGKVFNKDDISDSFEQFRGLVSMVKKMVNSPSFDKENKLYLDEEVYRKIVAYDFFEMVLNKENVKLNINDYTPYDKYWKDVIGNDFIKIGVDEFKKNLFDPRFNQGLFGSYCEISESLVVFNFYSLIKDINSAAHVEALIDMYPEVLDVYPEKYLKASMKAGNFKNLKQRLIESGTYELTDDKDSFLSNIRKLDIKKIEEKYRNLGNLIFKALDKRNFLDEFSTESKKSLAYFMFSVNPDITWEKYRKKFLSKNILTENELYMQVYQNNAEYILESPDIKITPGAIKEGLYGAYNSFIHKIIENNPEILKEKDVLLLLIFLGKVKDEDINKIFEGSIKITEDDFNGFISFLNKNVSTYLNANEKAELINLAYKYPEKFDFDDAKNKIGSIYFKPSSIVIKNPVFFSYVKSEEEFFDVLIKLSKSFGSSSKKKEIRFEKFIKDEFIQNDEFFCKLLEICKDENLEPVNKNSDIYKEKFHYHVLFKNESFKNEWTSLYGEDVSVYEVIKGNEDAIWDTVVNMKKNKMRQDIVGSTYRAKPRKF